MVRGSNRRLSAPFYVRATQGVRARPVRVTGAWARVGTAGGANSNNVLVLVSRCPLAALGVGGRRDRDVAWRDRDSRQARARSEQWCGTGGLVETGIDMRGRCGSGRKRAATVGGPEQLPG
jgi:hypothetical protein